MTTTIQALIEKARRNREIKRKAVALSRAKENIQLCEYERGTYICIGGVPCINVKHLKSDLYAVLEDARATSSDYISTRV